MDIIIFDGESYRALHKALSIIRDRLRMICGTTPAKEKWLDNQDVCLLLGISKRTLQSLRDKGMLGFSQIRHKCYYRESDVMAFIEKMRNKPGGGQDPGSAGQDRI